MKPIFFFKKLATNFLELETTFKYLEAKRLLDKNVNFVPCSCDKHFHRASEISRGRGAAKFKYIREIPRNWQKHVKYREIR